MALDAPAPWGLGRRRPEEREIIKFRIAREAAARPFQLRQDRLEAHDRRGFLIAGRAETRFQKLHRQLALILVELFERDSLAVARDEVPVESLLVAEFETRFRLLFGRERNDKFVCGFGHHGGGTHSRHAVNDRPGYEC